MTRATAFWAAMAGAGSAALLGGALAFQYLGGLAPCPMCLWQRWPHLAAVLIALALLWLGWRWLAVLGAGAAAVTAGIGAYHAGVEQKWWAGPSTCSGAGPAGPMSTEDLMTAIMEAPIVRCDDIPWEMLGVSMAGWNAIVSLGLVALWLRAARG